jgi:hypothetical protein
VPAIEDFDAYLARSDADPAKANVIGTTLRPQALAATGHVKIEDPKLAGRSSTLTSWSAGASPSWM